MSKELHQNYLSGCANILQFLVKSSNSGVDNNNNHNGAHNCENLRSTQSCLPLLSAQNSYTIKSVMIKDQSILLQVWIDKQQPRNWRLQAKIFEQDLAAGHSQGYKHPIKRTSSNSYNIALINQEDLGQSIQKTLFPNTEVTIMEYLQSWEKNNLLYKNKKEGQWVYNIPYAGKFLTIALWRGLNTIRHKNTHDLADCFIQVGKKKFYANTCLLGPSSNIIFNFIKDAKHFGLPKDCLDLSTLFIDITPYYVYLYLCMIYNTSQELELLTDVLYVLSMALRLKDENLIQRILEMKSLDFMIEQQSLVAGAFSDHTCHVINVLKFAAKHDLSRLVTSCEFQIIKSGIIINIKQGIPLDSIIRIYNFVQQQYKSNNKSINLSTYQQYRAWIV
eukprot:TRINITY_DN49506_c0_g1_i1.p1 TRINITY_DN49506_c0_g1~~TRINITY_DN49506_c0_g1_i1.p1  ORF type:complete len:390 (-),score=3.19 TRINITY_DN49506_c0_g1_i1:344-1513(-)